MAATRGAASLPRHAAVWRTCCIHALASLPVEQEKGSVLCSLNRGDTVLLPLLPLLPGLQPPTAVKYQTLKLLGLSSAAPMTCEPAICVTPQVTEEWNKGARAEGVVA